MTTTPPEAPPGPTGDPGEGPRTSRDEIRDLGRFRRTVHGSPYKRHIGGVAGGLARHLDIDPVIVRVVFFVLAFFGGAGLLGYGACWLLVPEEGSDTATVRLDDRNRTVALWVVGGLAALALIGDSFGGWGFPWPLWIVGVVVLLVVLARGGSPTHPGPYRPYGPASGPVPPGHHPGAPLPPYPVRRRQGPLLFWFTMALVALGIGILATVDVAGVDVADSAYPALALGVIGVMLLVGAFYGRAGGLILVGLVAAVATAGATAAGEIDGGRIDQSPTSAASVDSRYSLVAGEILLDLRDVEDVDELDGRTLQLDVDLGRIEVLVPEGLDVNVEADVEGAGESRLFGDVVSGSDSARLNGGRGVPTLDIDAAVTLGQIEIDTTDERIIR